MPIALLIITALLAFIALASFALWFVWPWVAHWREMMNPLTRAKAELELERQVLGIESLRASITRQHTETHMLQVRHVGCNEALVNVSDGSFYQNLTLHASPQQMLQLPQPAPQVVPHDVWFPKAVRGVHVILLGETDAGKSVFAKALAYERSKTGDVAVLDPHGRAKDWGASKIIGAGRNYEEIDKFMVDSLAELSNRYKIYEAGQNEFRRLTVVSDESTSIKKKCKSWPDFFSDMTCEGRKVGMSLVLSIHGKGVKTLGIAGEGDLRHNLLFIYLGKHAVTQMPESGNMERPAVMELDGVCQMIDTSQLPMLAASIAVPPVLSNENPRSAPVLQPFSSVPRSPQERIAERVKEMYEKPHDLSIAQCILNGMNKTNTREMVGGNTQTTGNRYDDIKAEIEAEIKYINTTQDQQFVLNIATGQVWNEEEQSS